MKNVVVREWDDTIYKTEKIEVNLHRRPSLPSEVDILKISVPVDQS